jgi:hypothetical protein
MAITVYAFVSSDPEIRGLSLDRGGCNIPADEQLSFWLADAVFPMTAQHVAKHVPDPHIALRDLKLRGYHLFRTTAQVIPFPRKLAS